MADLNDLTQNVNIWNDDKSKAVTVTTDGAKERLDVDANVTGGVTIQAFTPLVDFSVANTALNTSTDTSLFSDAGPNAGKIDFINIDGSNSNYEVVLKVDGVEIFRLSPTTVGTTLGMTGNTGLQTPFWTETANKNFRYHPNQPADFTDSWEILAKATTTPTPTVNWLTTHRDEQ